MLNSCLPLGFSKATWSLSPWVCSASKTETPGPQLDSKDSPASCLHAHRVEAGGQGSPLHLRVTPSKPGAHGVSAEPRASQGWPSNLAHTCAWVTGQPGYGPSAGVSSPQCTGPRHLCKQLPIQAGKGRSGHRQFPGPHGGWLRSRGKLVVSVGGGVLRQGPCSHPEP